MQSAGLAKTVPNKAVNSEAFFIRCAHYKCASDGWSQIA
jgi:hypothetical protein